MSRNGENGSDSNDSNSPDDKAFINKLLIQMKSQFNRADKVHTDNPETDAADSYQDQDQIMASQEDAIIETIECVETEEYEGASAKSETTEQLTDCEVSEEDSSVDSQKGKPRIVLTFRKPSKPLRNRDNTKEVVLKRSSRRRSKDCNESVLQSAIARKEKSYNESNKPQRLTRQLKPTQKILDNIANAVVKLEKNKSKTDEGEEIAKKYKSRFNHMRNGKGEFKKLRLARDSDSNQSEGKLSDSNGSLSSESSSKASTKDFIGEERLCRRSLRILSSRYKEEDVDTDQTDSSTAELNSTENITDSEKSSDTVSRFCLCTENTQIFVSPREKEIVYCTAVDSINEKMVGCNNVADITRYCLLRPSYRVPYIILCNVHYNRMLRHNCCPTCGLFCTQGTFAECSAKHQYHRDCQVTAESCPHCGAPTLDDVQITMHSSSKPVFLPMQKDYCPLAKMTFSDSKDGDVAEQKSPPLLKEELMDVCLNKCVMDDEKYEILDLFSCIRNNNMEKLSAVIASGQIHVNTSLPDVDNGTALHYASKLGLLSAVHLLRAAGAEIDPFDKERNTPLAIAIASFKNDVVRYLIKAGASLTLKGTDGMTPIHLAAKCGNFEACELLLEAAFSLRDYINNEDDGGWTPLIWACEHGHTKIAKYLINKGANLHRRDVEQNLALHWAAFSDSSHITECLLNCGSDINCSNVHGDTALHIAARQNNYNTVLVLLARGADVSVANGIGETALDCSGQNSLCYKAIALNFHLNSVAPAQAQKIILTNDISKGKEASPIQCVNTVDDESEPTDYVYVPKNCLTSGIDIDCKITTMQSCTCNDKCDSNSCVCGKNSVHCWYDAEGKLTLHFNYTDPPMIFECNDICNCNVITCRNRVVQRGTVHAFQLFKTETKGWSIRALCDIPKGGFVCEYVGEIISDEEAERREDDSFLFDLDNRNYFRNNENDTFCIDAKSYGNFARFINHSCDANLIPVRVFVDHHDLRFPRIALFANRKIATLEELSFDYGDKFWSVKSKNFGCYCNAPNCRYNKMEED